MASSGSASSPNPAPRPWKKGKVALQLDLCIADGFNEKHKIDDYEDREVKFENRKMTQMVN